MLWYFVGVRDAAVSLEQIQTDSEKFAQNIRKQGNTAAIAMLKLSPTK
jgi:hypothetical protein